IPEPTVSTSGSRRVCFLVLADGNSTPANPEATAAGIPAPTQLARDDEVNDGPATRRDPARRRKAPRMSRRQLLTFAARKHKDQRRKDAKASPYINHPIALAEVLWTDGKVPGYGHNHSSTASRHPRGYRDHARGAACPLPDVYWLSARFPVSVRV